MTVQPKCSEESGSPSSLQSSGGLAFLASLGSNHDVVLVLWLPGHRGDTSVSTSTRPIAGQEDEPLKRRQEMEKEEKRRRGKKEKRRRREEEKRIRFTKRSRGQRLGHFAVEEEDEKGRMEGWRRDGIEKRGMEGGERGGGLEKGGMERWRSERWRDGRRGGWREGRRDRGGMEG